LENFTRIPQKTLESPAGYTHRRVAQRSTKDQVVELHLQLGVVSSCCRAMRVAEENCEVFQNLDLLQISMIGLD